MLPHFVNSSLESDSSLTVHEYSNVSLDCRAVANPTPIVKWKREDGQPFLLNSLTKGKQTSLLQGVLNLLYLTDKDAAVATGDVLTLYEVTRWSTGAYICVVTSGVSPAISRRIMLNVQFPPMIKIPAQVVSVMAGQSVTLECITEVSHHPCPIWYV